MKLFIELQIKIPMTTKLDVPPQTNVPRPNPMILASINNVQ
jgi:hypothetical protein